jgi:hypothetical protein
MPPVKRFGVVWGCLAALVAAVPSALAQEVPPPVQMRRLPEGVAPPQIDGWLDDTAWKHAARIGTMVQKEPLSGEAPTYQTEVRLLYDSDALYVAIEALDAEPEKIIARTMRRDQPIVADDWVNVNLDTFHDGRNGYFFGTNPNSSRNDGIVENGAFRMEWDGIWYVKSRRNERGWIAEYAIPFKTLNFDPANTTWGFNSTRVISRLNEESRWASWGRNRTFFDFTALGDLEGLEGLEQGVGLDVVPSGSLTSFKDRIADRDYATGEPSLDLFYKLTPSVTAALTLNTDFSDAEVDTRQVNLDRFALFFPETRDFFLQDAGIFDFGRFRNVPLAASSFLSQNGMPYFSRRIGIGDDGEVVDMRGGAKTTGRIGRLSFGVFGADMAHYRNAGGERVEGKNLWVARGKWNLGEESYAGFIVTHGDPTTNGSNSVVGADLHLRSDRIFGDKILEFNAWLQQSHTSGDQGRDESLGLVLNYPNDRWNWRLGFKRLDEDFRPALGFLNRIGVHESIADIRRRWRPLSGDIRWIDLSARARLITTVKGALQTFESQSRLEITNHIGDSIAIEGAARAERVLVPFEIADGAFVRAGRYDWMRGLLRIGSSDRRALSASISVSAGGFFSGHLRSLDTHVVWRPTEHFSSELTYREDHGRLDDGNFTTRLIQWRVNLTFTPDISWSTFIQWDDSSQDLGWNSRLRWIVREGEEFVLVWNQGFDTTDHHLHSTRSEWIGKIRWTFRF